MTSRTNGSSRVVEGPRRGLWTDIDAPWAGHTYRELSFSFRITALLRYGMRLIRICRASLPDVVRLSAYAALLIASTLLSFATVAQTGEDIARLRALCAQFGYQEGTPENAQCVERQFNQKLRNRSQQDDANVERLRHACEATRQQAVYWCTQMRTRGGALAGMKCAEYEAEFRQNCM